MPGNLPRLPAVQVNLLIVITVSSRNYIKLPRHPAHVGLNVLDYRVRERSI